MTLNEHDLFNLCLEEGWEPLFLTSSNQSLKAIQSQLQRELNVALADGQRQLVQRLLRVLRDHQAEDIVSSLDADCTDHYLKLGRPPRKQPSADKIRTKLVECLRGFQVAPAFLEKANDTDLAEYCGREMRHLRSLERHDVVVHLGELASWLRLKHQRIDINLRASRLAIQRSNQLTILLAIKESRSRSRRQYEDAILKAWAADPDCGDFIDLLKKLFLFRSRRQSEMTELDEFELERVDHDVNKRLWNYLRKAQGTSVLSS